MLSVDMFCYFWCYQYGNVTKSYRVHIKSNKMCHFKKPSNPLYTLFVLCHWNNRASWMYMTLSSCMKYFKEGVIVDSSSIIIRSQVANDETNLCWCDLGEDPYIGCHGIFTFMTLLEIIGESLGIQCVANFKKTSSNSGKSSGWQWLVAFRLKFTQ